MKYNVQKGKKYDPTTYTNFTPEPFKKTKAQKEQEVETKYRIMISSTIAKKLSEGESSIDFIVNEISKNPLIVEHYKHLIEKGFNLPELFKKWYEGYKPYIEKPNKGIDK